MPVEVWTTRTTRPASISSTTLRPRWISTFLPVPVRSSGERAARGVEPRPGHLAHDPVALEVLPGLEGEHGLLRAVVPLAGDRVLGQVAELRELGLHGLGLPRRGRLLGRRLGRRVRLRRREVRAGERAPADLDLLDVGVGAGHRVDDLGHPREVGDIRGGEVVRERDLGLLVVGLHRRQRHAVRDRGAVALLALGGGDALQQHLHRRLGPVRGLPLDGRQGLPAQDVDLDRLGFGHRRQAEHEHGDKKEKSAHCARV